MPSPLRKSAEHAGQLESRTPASSKVAKWPGWWVYDLRGGQGWKALNPVCQRRDVHSVAEMVP